MSTGGEVVCPKYPVLFQEVVWDTYQLLDKRKWTRGCVSHFDGMLLCESTYIYLFFVSNILTASFMKDSMNECAKTHRWHEKYHNRTHVFRNVAQSNTETMYTFVLGSARVIEKASACDQQLCDWHRWIQMGEHTGIGGVGCMLFLGCKRGSWMNSFFPLSFPNLSGSFIVDE